MAFSGFQDFNPNFASPLQAMIAARPGISVNSGYRSNERQAELYAAAIQKYGSPEKARHWVAPPGHSMHNKGLGADLAFATPEDRQWAHDNAAQYGLTFRMGHEPWHIELVGGKQVAVGDKTGQPVTGNGGQVATAWKPGEDREIPRSAQTLYAATPDVQFQSPIQASPLNGAQDINSLAGLVSPRRVEKAKAILDNIRAYS